MTMREGIQADVQGLRGIAVLMVVLYHAGAPLLSGGYVGVDVFFVISGYVITGLLYRERQATGRIDFGRFYARRARRLLPAALVVVAATLVVGRLLYSPFEQQQSAASALSAALYVSNFWFAGRATDYLAGTSEHDPFLHTWSLAVEEQFYLVWPGLVVLALLGAKRERLGARLLFTVTAVAIVSLFVCRHLTWKSQPWAFFGAHTRAWEFAAGAIAFLIARHVAALPSRLVGVGGWLGAACVAAAMVTFDRRTPFPGTSAALPVFGTFLLLLSGRAGKAVAPSMWLSSRWLVWLGDISYSWYLWHWPILVFFALALGEMRFASTAMAVGVSLLLAVLSFRLVENPIRFSAYLSGRVRASLIGALALTFGGAVLALTAQYDATANLEGASQHRISAARKDRARVYGTECHAKYDAVSVPECVFLNPDSPREVVLFGDSHAAHWFPALEQLATTENWRLVSLTKSACPSVETTVFNKVKNREYVECDKWRTAVIERLVRQRPALVVLSNASNYVNEFAKERDGVASLEAWAGGLEKLIARLTSVGIGVAVIRDTPSPGFDVPLCLARAAMTTAEYAGRCTFRISATLAPLAELTQIEREAVASHEGAMLIDLTHRICPDEECRVDQGGRIVFSDTGHLTATFSRFLAPYLLAQLRAHGAENIE